ncbi:hypothetical protein AAE478_006425 [Parahypoxylon ruwenzoriense]
MEDEIIRLRSLLQEERRRREEEERRREEEERRREEEERRREEEERRREEAEKRAEVLQPLTLQQYIDAYHSLSLAIRVVTDPSTTTQGNTTNPVGRVFPQRIIPWDDFATVQEEVWRKLLDSPSFSSEAIFPTSHQLEFVASMIYPISSEAGLRSFEGITVEHPVQKLVNAAYDDLPLRASLDIQGPVAFESHTNLGDNAVDNTTTPIEHLPVDEDGARAATTPAGKPAVSRVFANIGKGKGGSADQFCIYKTSDGRNIPVLAIEYKAPHKLTKEEVLTGLRSEIQPKRDIINKNSEGFVFASKWLTTAVITQLYSYMITKGIQYGYVSTGETFIFLHIPDDPLIVYYYACVPNLDVLDDDENRLHRTAVAQVFAFVLMALRTRPPSVAWYDRALSQLGVWVVEYDDVLKRIPETVRKQPPMSPYKPGRWKAFERSPIRTRSRCRDPNVFLRSRDEDGSDDEDAPTSPSLRRSAHRNNPAARSATNQRQGQGQGQRSQGDTPDDKQQRAPAKTHIEDRPYCTHKCLLGLANGCPMDQECPNAADHGQAHLDPPEFLRLIRAQLAQDRGPDADAIPLYISGAIGSLFKVCLSAHGYTLVAKGVEQEYLVRLQHEQKIYNQLRSIQGKHVPVCLGMIDLVLPYYYDGGVFEYFMFLSWAGRPLHKVAEGAIGKDTLIGVVAAAFRALHQLQVLHGDAEPRNVLYDVHAGRAMIVDFERAQVVRDRWPLGPTSPNRKRKHGTLQKQTRDDFSMEVQSIIASVRHF